jgi:hypothetical protein
MTVRLYVCLIVLITMWIMAGAYVGSLFGTLVPCGLLATLL